jgi:uncharacterized protein YaaN involved in tellurite resistance
MVADKKVKQGKQQDKKVEGNGDGEPTDVMSMPVEVKPANKPDTLSREQIKNIQKRADDTVKVLIKAKGTEVLTAEDQISNVGVQDQKTVSSGIALLQEKMGRVFYSDNKSKTTDALSRDIENLQQAIAKVNPTEIEKETKYRIIRIVPFFGNWLVHVLKAAANRRMSLQQFVGSLEEGLKSSEVMLRQDNAQLKVMYGDLQNKQDLIKADAYFAEVLMEKLQDAISSAADEKKAGRLRKVLFKVSVRAQDLRALENVHEQFFVGIEMTRDNNDGLIATVQRMLTMGMNVVYISFAIHAALARQRDVIQMQRGTRDFLGNMIVSNATMINSHIKEIGDLFKEPVIAIAKLSEAANQLEQAIDAANRMKSEVIDRSKENIIKIKTMTDEIRAKAGALPDTDIKSLEASNTLELPEGRG